jgi:hypothetical protein
MERRKFTREFKLEAVRLIKERGVSYMQAAQDDCDFLSMYPTVCTLMRLWQFVIAKGITWRESTGAGHSAPGTRDRSELAVSKNLARPHHNRPRVGSSGDFLPPSPPAQKATARQDQAGTTRLRCLKQKRADRGAPARL